MKITIIGKSDRNGGGASKCSEIVKEAMQARGHEVELFAVHPVGPGSAARPLFSRSTARLIRLLHAVCRRGAGGEFLPMEWPRLKRLAQTTDLIHISDHWSAISPWSVAWLARRISTVLTLHDCSFFTGGCLYSFGCERFRSRCGRCPQKRTLGMPVDVTPAAMTLKRRLFATSPLSVVASSEWMAKQARSSRLFAGPVHVVRNAADFAVYTPSVREEARKKLGIQSGEKVVLLAANSLKDPRKNTALGIDSMRLLAPGSATVLFVGASSESLGADLPLRVMRTGHLSSDARLAEAYAAADVYLFPSLADNCPLSVIESLAVGTPVIALDAGGTPELISPSISGVLIDTPDPRKFAAALATMLDDPEKLGRMRHHAAQSAVSRFSLETHGAAMESVYHRALHARHRQL